MESANGAFYTSLGHRPRKIDGFIFERAESPFYSATLPLFIVRAFSPMKKGTPILGRRFACPRLV